MSFYTIGHSTRSTDELVALLKACDVQLVADVRAMPRSRSNPQFHEAALAPALAGHGIGYEHLAPLGGLRNRQPEVPGEVNGYWRNRSFHNYADHALSDEFLRGLERLIELGRLGPCAIMCAEAVWWRCHRRIIADHLLHLGHPVHHVLGPDDVRPAKLTPGAVTDAAGHLVYPAVQP